MLAQFLGVIMIAASLSCSKVSGAGTESGCQRRFAKPSYRSQQHESSSRYSRNGQISGIFHGSFTPSLFRGEIHPVTPAMKVMNKTMT